MDPKNSSICCSSGDGGDRSSWLSQYLVYGSTPYGYTEDLRPYPARSCAQLATSLVSMMPGQPTRQSSRAKGSMVELFLFAHLKVGRHVPYVRWKKKTADQNSGQPMEFISETSAKCWQTCPKFARHTCRAITARSSSNAERAVTVNVGRLTTASAS